MNKEKIKKKANKKNNNNNLKDIENNIIKGAIIKTVKVDNAEDIKVDTIRIEITEKTTKKKKVVKNNKKRIKIKISQKKNSLPSDSTKEPEKKKTKRTKTKMLNQIHLEVLNQYKISLSPKISTL